MDGGVGGIPVVQVSLAIGQLKHTPSNLLDAQWTVVSVVSHVASNPFYRTIKTLTMPCPE